MSDSMDSSEKPLTEWALVDREGELQDTESLSTTSSVEILDDDNHDITSPDSPITGENCPLKFVLRLPKKDQVVDTDDDLTSRDTESDSTTSSQTFTTRLISPHLASSSFIAMTTGGDTDNSAVGSSCPSMMKQPEREPEMGKQGTKPVIVGSDAGNRSNSPISCVLVGPSKGLAREPDNDAKTTLSASRQISEEDLENLRKTLDDIKGKYMTRVRNSDEMVGDRRKYNSSSFGSQGFISSDSSLSTDYSFISRETDVHAADTKLESPKSVPDTDDDIDAAGDIANNPEKKNAWSEGDTGVIDGVADDYSAAYTATTTGANNRGEAGDVGPDGVEDVDGRNDGNDINDDGVNEAVGNNRISVKDVWEMFEDMVELIQHGPRLLQAGYLVLGCLVLVNVAFIFTVISARDDGVVAVQVGEAGLSREELEQAILYAHQQKQLYGLDAEISSARYKLTQHRKELAILQNEDSELEENIKAMKTCCDKKKTMVDELEDKLKGLGSDLKDNKEFKEHGINVLCFDLCQKYKTENVTFLNRLTDDELELILIQDGDLECGYESGIGRCLKRRQEELLHIDVLQTKINSLEASQSVAQEKEAEIERLKRQLSDCTLRNSRNKYEGKGDDSKKTTQDSRKESTEDKWLACQALLFDIYQQQYDEMNTSWEELKMKMSELVQIHFPTEWYNMIQRTGAFETSSGPDSSTSGDNSRREESFTTADDTDNDKPDDRRGTFVDSVFKVMNETRGKVHQTWEKVKNMSDNLWEKHGSSLQRLGNTFTENVQSLSNKFQRKVAKKINKWFNKDKKQTGKQNGRHSKGANSEEDEQAEKGKGGNFRGNKQDGCHVKGNNQRRNKQERQKEAEKQRMNRDKVGRGKGGQERRKRMEAYAETKWQDSTIEEEGQMVKKKFNKLRTYIRDGDFKALRYKPAWWDYFRLHIREFTSTFWFDLLKGKCQEYISAQEQWWERQHIIGPDFYCDWQWAVSEPNLKRGLSCFDLPKNCLKSNWRYLLEVARGEVLSDDKFEDTDDKLIDAADDDNLFDDDDGEVQVEGEDNWYLERAADREYQHEEPDSWYFRKSKDREARKYLKNQQKDYDGFNDE